MRGLRARRLAGLVAAVGWVCGCSAEFGEADGASDGGVFADGGRADGGGVSAGGCVVGRPCQSGADCPEPYVCQAEVAQAYEVEGLEGGQLTEPLFPGGACTPVAAAPLSESSCDPTRRGEAQGCGACGTCVPFVFGSELEVACRERCSPSARTSGCDNEGYTCDFRWEACVEGCSSDEACRVETVDVDGDGQPDLNRYDADSPARCDPDTRRCEHPGRAGAEAGDACEQDVDCEADGVCIREASPRGDFAWSGGYCSKLGCALEGRPCAGEDSVCGAVRSLYGAFDPDNHVWRTLDEQRLCLRGCRVAAEPGTDRTGSEGHGQGCRPGYRCAWNGIDGDEPLNGVCTGGNYNDVGENNVGQPCQRHSDCYSPYGHGMCLEFAGPGGAFVPLCTILDCAAPGMPEDVCGDQGVCLSDVADFTVCHAACDIGEDCPAGFACADEDGDPATAKICVGACIEDAECRAGERCAGIDPATGLGSCEPE